MTFEIHTHLDPGLWLQCNGGTTAQKRPALFLDRDGVLVEEINYLHTVADLRIIPAATSIVRAANERGIPVVIVTNQSGVGRGYYGWAEFAVVQAALADSFAQDGAHFDMILACAYHTDAEAPYDTPNHPWRKPQPGMLHAAAETLELDLPRSWIVGDSASDIGAGRNAGLAGGVHVATGHGRRDRDKALALATAEFDVRAEASIEGAEQILTLCTA